MVKLHEGRKNGTNENFDDSFEDSFEDNDEFFEDDDDFFDIFQVLETKFKIQGEQGEY